MAEPLPLLGGSRTIPNWLGLSSDIWCDIAGRISCLQDFIVFGAVCTKWRFVAMKAKARFSSSPKLVPWLLLVDEKEEGESSSAREYFNPSKRKIYSISLPKAINNRSSEGNFYNPSFMKEKRYYLSSKGWFLILKNKSQLRLFNPFSLSTIDLPESLPVERKALQDPIYWSSHVCGLALSCCPSLASDFQIMIVYRVNSFPYNERLRLAFCEHGDHAWSEIALEFQPIDMDITSDMVITYHEGLFYVACAVNYWEDFVVVEIDLNQNDDIDNEKKCTTRMRSFPNPWMAEPQMEKFTFKFWLVSSSTSLSWSSSSSQVLMLVFWKFYFDGDIIRYIRSDYYQNSLYSEFAVYEIDFESGEWSKVNNFGDKALFLGYRSSCLVDVSNESRFKSNNIYFVTNKSGVGVYDMADGTIEPLVNGANYVEWIEPRL